MRATMLLPPGRRPKVTLSPELLYVLALLVGTRLALTVIGVIARMTLIPLVGRAQWVYAPTAHLWLDIWAVWDAGSYLDIVRNGYSARPMGPGGEANYAFFPLYPMLMKALGYVIGDPYIAGLLVANVALVVAAVILYRLVRLDAEDSTALSAVKYLFFFPTAFILSGAFSESLFLATTVGSFYYARRGCWAPAGVLAGLAALTRVTGALLLLPLGIVYLQRVHWNLRRIRPDMLWLLLGPLAALAFAFYVRSFTGDLMAVIRIRGAWGATPTNPAEALIAALASGRLQFIFNAAFALTALLLLGAFAQRIGLAYWLLGTYTILLPLASGVGYVLGMGRYVLTIFPLYIILAVPTRNRPALDHGLTAFAGLLQGFLMVYWTSGSVLLGL